MLLLNVHEGILGRSDVERRRKGLLGSMALLEHGVDGSLGDGWIDYP